MDPNPNIFAPPVPRDQEGPTESELIPFKSTKINILKSKILLPFLVVAFAVTALFVTRGNPMLFMQIVASVGVVGIFYAVHQYSGVQKELWYYVVPGLIAWFLLEQCFSAYTTIFRHVLPGDLASVEGDTNFIKNFMVYFFAAGLCEESLKATPIVLAFLLTLKNPALRTAPVPGLLDIFQGRASFGSLLSGLALRGPLDGMLMGFAAGAAFILDETLGEYIDRAWREGMEAGGAGVAGYRALSLLIPRVFQGVSGHMAWAGITGYFIGLGVLYPKRALKLGLVGYLAAALLHTLWDTVANLPFPEFWLVVVSAATVILFVACLLKAKQLQLASGSISAASGSILVGGSYGQEIPTPQANPAQVVAAAAAPTANAGGFLAGLQGLASSLEHVAGGLIKPVGSPPAAAVAAATGTPAPSAAPAPTPPPAPVAAASATADRFAIGSARARYALEPGHAIDFGALFGAEGAPSGATGEIAVHPTHPDVLGLRNTGASAWTVVTPEGATVTVPPGKSLKISAGSKLMFGALALEIASY